MMRVYTFEASGVALIPETSWNTPSGPRIAWADRIPTTGYWKIGDRLTIGKNTFVCTTEGSPGTWEADGGVPVLGSAFVSYAPFKLRAFTGIVVSAQNLGTGQSRINFFPNFDSIDDYSISVTQLFGLGTGEGVVSVQKAVGYVNVQGVSFLGALQDVAYDLIIVKNVKNPISPLPA